MKRTKAKRPAKLFYYLFAFILSLITHLTRHVHVSFTNRNGKTFKGRIAKAELLKVRPPYIILGNHASSFDHVHTLRFFYPRRISFVVARRLFYTPKVATAIRIARSIPKDLFQADLSYIRGCVDILKSNGIVCLYPESQIQVDGVSRPVPEKLGKLLKTLDVPVLTVRISGSYFSDNNWRKFLAHGPVYVEVTETLSKEEVQSLSIEAINAIVEEAIYVDNFAEQEKHNAHYYGFCRAKGLENILYRCPVCQNEFTLKTKNNDIFCTECGVFAHYGTNGRFSWHHIENPKEPGNQRYEHINAWYQDQLKYERDTIRHMPARSYTFGCELQILTESETDITLATGEELKVQPTRGIRKAGLGVFSITKLDNQTFCYSYNGSFYGKQVTIEFTPESVRHLPFTPGHSFQIYGKQIMYAFTPLDSRRVTKIALITEAISEQLKTAQN